MALESPLSERVHAIHRALAGFKWAPNREVACIGLAELARTLEHERRVELAREVGEWCNSKAGDYCRSCPVNRARLQ